MSASLVGSEMCIRDRARALPQHRARPVHPERHRPYARTAARFRFATLPNPGGLQLSLIHI
eukprot:9968898-Alexandrium_andersonii.AAC.1